MRPSRAWPARGPAVGAGASCDSPSAARTGGGEEGSAGEPRGSRLCSGTAPPSRPGTLACGSNLQWQERFLSRLWQD